MPRHLTDKLQISGYRQEVQRYEQGFVSRDVRGFSSPFSKQPTWWSGGLALAGVILLVGYLLAVLTPASRMGDAKVLATKSGSRFVVVDGVIHPVMNLSSARLIAGSNESAKTVKDSELSKRPRGMLMGIAAAPDEMRARKDDESRWAVCSQYDSSTELSLTGKTRTRTLVIAGGDSIESQNVVGEDRALLVGSLDAGDKSGAGVRVWLLYKGLRYEVTESSYALKATLGATDQMIDNAKLVQYELIDSIPAGKSLGKPTVDADGQPSQALPQFSVGTVLKTAGSISDDYWLVEKRGVQKIGPFVAQLMANSGSIVNQASPQTMSSAPQRSDIDLAAYPWASPRLITDQDTICYDWSRRGQANASGRLLAQASVPLSKDDRAKAVAFLPSRDLTPQANFFFTTPGQGWLVYATGEADHSHETGQVWWVSDSGVRYPLGGSETLPIAKVVAALGINGVSPHPVPWSILRLLPQGPTLSADAARVVHATIPPDVAQGRVPDVKELN